jgi:hypothetical protein
MTNEEFEKWAASMGYDLEVDDGSYESCETEGALAGWLRRQPEIDALILKNAELEGKILKHQLWESEEIDTLRAEIDTLKSNKVNEIAWHIDVINRENAALKADVEKWKRLLEDHAVSKYNFETTVERETMKETMLTAGHFALIDPANMVNNAVRAEAVFKAMYEAAPTPPAQEAGTSAAKWRESGEPDPHGKQYDCERAALCMGNLTDDELANAVFLHGNEKPDIQAVMRGEAYMPLSYLTAAKDRIRWLSRKVEELASKAAPAQEAEPVQRWRPTKGDINKIKMEVSPIGKYVRYSDYIKAVRTQSAPSDELRRAAEETLKFLSEPEKMNKLGDYIKGMCIARDNLRAALEGK